MTDLLYPSPCPLDAPVIDQLRTDLAAANARADKAELELTETVGDIVVVEQERDRLAAQLDQFTVVCEVCGGTGNLHAPVGDSAIVGVSRDRACNAPGCISGRTPRNSATLAAAEAMREAIGTLFLDYFPEHIDARGTFRAGTKLSAALAAYDEAVRAETEVHIIGVHFKDQLAALAAYDEAVANEKAATTAEPATANGNRTRQSTPEAPLPASLDDTRTSTEETPEKVGARG